MLQKSELVKLATNFHLALLFMIHWALSLCLQYALRMWSLDIIISSSRTPYSYITKICSSKSQDALISTSLFQLTYALSSLCLVMLIMEGSLYSFQKVLPIVSVSFCLFNKICNFYWWSKLLEPRKVLINTFTLYLLTWIAVILISKLHYCN